MRYLTCSRLAWLGVLLLLPAGQPAASAARPVVAGFERFYSSEKANLPSGGRLLLGELNCTGCHATPDKAAPRKQAPILDGVGGRVRVRHLRKFLADPQAVKPGTTMPNLLAKDPDAK